LSAAEGIGSSEQLETDAATLSVSNSLTNDISIFDNNNILLLSASNVDGNINIAANNNLNLAAGLLIETANTGDINLRAGNTINGSGALTVNSAGGFSFDKTLNTGGNTTITAANQLNITESINATAGFLSLNGSAVTFANSVVLTAADSININADTTVTGDLVLNANSIDLLNALSLNNGDLTLNAGNGGLSISAAVTVNSGNINLTTSDLAIAAGGSITGSDTVSISDNGNGMELGGTADPTKLNISLIEYELISAGRLVLSTQNTITLKDTFQTTNSATPLTINANQLNVTQAGTVLGLLSNLDMADTAVNAAADFSIDVAGTFDMSNTIITHGNFSLNSGQGIVMGEPSAIISNNGLIDIKASGGDIRLGLVDAGIANVNLTASAGSVLNNNGVFADVTKSRTNIKGASTTIIANQRIGASSTDAITIDTSPAGLISLDFNAEKAFINNLQNTRISNNGSGDVAVGLIFSGQIIGVGHNVGVNSQNAVVEPAQDNNDSSLMSVLGSDYKLSTVDEEEEDSSTLNTVVPVMIRTKDGWEFKVPLRNPDSDSRKNRRVNWL